MKFTTINSLLVLSCLATTVAHANDTQAKQVKTATEIKIGEIKCGPLADFYELVAQGPKVNQSANSLAKDVSESKNTVNTTLAANTGSKSGQKID